MQRASLLLLLCWAATQHRVVGAGEAELEQLINKMESDVVELARAVENAYQNRCESALESCSLNNYDECLSEYPSPICPATDELVVEVCRGGGNCASLIDTSVSAVSLPSKVGSGVDGNPTDPQVIETVCYSRQLDSWFQEKRARDASYWRSFGVESPQMFFGSQDGGMFRVHPARHSPTCGDFDPRTRPWYIAASSGPKNIVLVLDVSGSMIGQRLELLKVAAKRVISTLTVADRVAIVLFNGSARVLGDGRNRLLTVTDANRQNLLQLIDSMTAGGGTNFHNAFRAALQVLEDSIVDELNVSCNTAVLFLTDGETNSNDEASALNIVTSGLARVEEQTGHPVMLFTFSIGNDSGNAATPPFPKRLACASSNGVWSKIIDDRELEESLGGYYRLFALGLGQDSNEGFVAWVEPFEFQPSLALGTVASAPVYDRSKTPHLFLGVVGFAFPLAAVDKALGVQAGDPATLNRIVAASTAQCPPVNLTQCEMESYRRQSSTGDDALCLAGVCNDSDFVQVETTTCPSVSDYPTNLWNNANLATKTYQERVCCSVGENEPSDRCGVDFASNNDDDNNNNTVMLLVVVGLLVLFLAIAIPVVVFVRRRVVLARKEETPTSSPSPSLSEIPVGDMTYAVAVPVPSVPVEQDPTGTSKLG